MYRRTVTERNPVSSRSSIPLFPIDPLSISAAQRFSLLFGLHLSGGNPSYFFQEKKKILNFPRDGGRQVLCNS